MNNQNFDNDLPLEFLFENAPVSLFWMDRHHIYRGCNLEACRAIGLNSREEVIRKDIFDLAKINNWPQFKVQEIYDTDERVMQTGIRTKTQDSILQNDGTSILQFSCKEPIFDENGQVIGLIGIAISNSTVYDQSKIIAP